MDILQWNGRCVGNYSFLNEEHAFWVRVLKSKYGVYGDFVHYELWSNFFNLSMKDWLVGN